MCLNAFAVLVSVNQQPTIGECSVKLYARTSPGAAERVVGTATCEAEGIADDGEEIEPVSVWVGAGLDFSRPDKGITKLEVNWQAQYTDQLPMPSRSSSPFFLSNAPVPIGITAGRFSVSFGGMWI